MKKRTLKKIGLLATVALIGLNGCGGGGSSPSTDTSGGGNTQVTTPEPTPTPTPEPTTTYYKSCLTKESTPTYRCVPECNDDEYVLNTNYNDANTCENDTLTWLTAFNKSDTPKTQEQVEGLEYLNQIRVSAGLLELKYSSLLEKASANHENYATYVRDTYNVNMSHYEDNDTYPSEYYTGVWPQDRAEYVGYPHSAGEVVRTSRSDMGENVSDSIDELMESYGHRFLMLSPKSKEIGLGGVERNFTAKSFPHLIGYDWSKADFIQSISKEVIVYPVDGQIDVPTSDVSTKGYPFTVEFNSKFYPSATGALDIEITSFTLSSDSMEVSSSVIGELNDPKGYLKSNQFALIPDEVLENNTTYAVELSYTHNGNDETMSTIFTTR